MWLIQNTWWEPVHKKYLDRKGFLISHAVEFNMEKRQLDHHEAGKMRTGNPGLWM